MTTEKDIENFINEEEANRNDLLSIAVAPDNELKNMLVEYVGTKFEKEEVTVQMIVDAMAHEFPEFVFSFAEENFIRGYQLGLDDAYKSVTGTAEKEPAEKL
tara:strand:- start:62 stop:367 length:306 start_codon:yes stop_codon:yes gene_type:complete